MKKISVLVKRPGEKPYHTNVSNSLANLQKLVGGYVEAVWIASDLVLLCDEEAIFKNSHFNLRFCGRQFFGTVILAGADDNDFCDLPCTWEQLKKLAPEFWEGGKKNDTEERPEEDDSALPFC